MKLFLIIILIGVIMLIAKSLSEQYKDKFDFYDNLKNFLNQYKINIYFKQEKIIEFLNNVKPKKHFKLFIELYKSYLENGELNLSKISLLEHEEIIELEEIIKNLGNHDAQTEINQLDMFLIKIENKTSKALQEKTKLCPMIIKLSFLFSIALAILLI